MSSIDRFKNGFSQTMEEEKITSIRKEAKQDGFDVILMGPPVRNIIVRTIDGLKCVLDPNRKSKKAKEAETMLAISAFQKEHERTREEPSN